MSEPRSVDLLIAAVKKYALDHYNEDGWDYVVECMGDMEIEDCFDDPLEGPTPTSVEEAIRCVAAFCKLWDDRRRDIQGTAF